MKKSEDLYKNLIEYLPNGIIFHRGKKVMYANKKALSILGYKDFKQMKNVTVDDIILPENKKLVENRWDKVKKNKDVPFIEMIIRSPYSGKRIEIESKPMLIKYHGGEMFQVIFRDISIQKRLMRETLRAQMAEGVAKKLGKEMKIRKKTEEELTKSLIEKESLLKEIHHRVKNNMQIVSSILNIQASTIKNEKIKKLFEESQDRIKSMALVHETLYNTKNMSCIDFKKYVSDLMQNLYRSYDIDNKCITYKLNLQKVFLSADIGIPCGLIINELISNSFKYAFGNLNKGVIFVQLKKIDDKVTLIIKDNGIGIDKDINIKNAKSLGLQLVYTLVAQIGGEITMKRTKGTKFIIKFNY